MIIGRLKFLLLFSLLLLTAQDHLFAQSDTRVRLDSMIKKAKAVYYASPDSSMNMGREILRKSDSIGYEMGSFEGLRLIGNSHFLLGRLDSAAYYMLKLLGKAYTTGNESMQADVMIDIGQVYDKIGLNSLAYDYFRQAHEIRLRTGDPERLSITFINLAYHYYLRDELDSALEYYKETEIILDTIPLTYTKPFLYNELGGMYLKKGQVDLAREHIQKAIELNLQMENNWDLSFNYATLAQLELAEGNPGRAEELSQKALSIAEESNIAIEKDLIYETLSKVKASQGLYQQAHEYLLESNMYTDSLEMAISGQKILALDNYKRQKDNEIEKLRLSNENLEQNAELTRQRLITIGIAVILAITIAALILLYKQNQKLSEARSKIEEQNDDLKGLISTKNKLFSIITHDIRNPLNNINGMLKLARDGHITAEEFNEYAVNLVDQTDRLTTLSETLINWSRSQQEGLSAQLKEISIDKMITQSIQYASVMAESKGIQLNYKRGDYSKVKADPNMLMLVLNNLLTNAIKFTTSNGKVDVWITENADTVTVHVSDTGIGIDSKLIQNLREGKVHIRQGTEKEKGSGVGLLLTQDLVSLLGGKLSAENNETEGSTFHVELQQA